MIMEIKVPTYKFKEMAKVLSVKEMAEDTDIRGTVFVGNNEYVIDSAWGTGTGHGWAKLCGHRVENLDSYTGRIKPLPYAEHYAECDFKRRERGGGGRIVKFGSRKLVTCEYVEFVEEKTGEQMGLF
jgi:hypothetical protein